MTCLLSTADVLTSITVAPAADLTLGNKLSASHIQLNVSELLSIINI